MDVLDFLFAQDDIMWNWPALRTISDSGRCACRGRDSTQPARRPGPRPKTFPAKRWRNPLQGQLRIMSSCAFETGHPKTPRGLGGGDGGLWGGRPRRGR